MNLTDLEQLTAAQDEAQRAAVESVRGAHSAALEGAQTLRDELAEAMGQGDEREALRAIIEAAAEKELTGKQGREMAGIIVGQFAAAVADMPLPASVSRNGSELVARCASAANGYAADQQRQLFAALVLACLDRSVKTGLLSFPSPAEWADKPSIEGLRTMGKVMDPEAVAALEAEHVARAAELAEAQRYVDALEQARPALFVLAEGVEPSTTVRNRRGGSVGIGSIKLEAGDTELSAEQYAAVRNNASFRAHLEAGALEIVSTASLVQEA
ncbi:hypothetical protein RSO68_03450 [Halomonas saccharevitans]|uniref:Uncharacterized protein n=1 Tax=Halomonas saccharevitans TaxID=416872 RepID=A0ABU3NBF6_9GAMM|nr:hypothetical protein [Halomonas saccharevitans]MDT8878521.1 hypothetical protein [Halomonas saccharevitans]